MSEKKYYQLLYNRAAGDHLVHEWTEWEIDNWQESGYRNQEAHFTEYGLYESEEELDRAIEDLRGPTVYAVFKDGSAGEVFVSEEDNLSGNWRGSKYGHFSCVGEYSHRADAENHADQIRAYTA